jgi:tetratricopeptide (TPR) repeat protein
MQAETGIHPPFSFRVRASRSQALDYGMNFHPGSGPDRIESETGGRLMGQYPAPLVFPPSPIPMQEFAMKKVTLAGAAFVYGLATATGAQAMGSDNPAPPPAPRPAPAPPPLGLSAAEAAVKAKQYEQAIAELEKVLAREPNNVDALNYMAYSHRELGRYEPSLAFYQRALAINPNHRGANEYLGQLYIKLGRMPEARAQLTKLQRLCGTRCEEYQSLKAALDAAAKRT